MCLADLLCGRSPLLDDQARPLFVRMARILAQLLGNGWLPHTHSADPVIWRPRECNVPSDHLCNLAMDTGISWNHIDKDLLHDCLTLGCNVQVHSDGGFRNRTCASTGWTIHVWRQSKTGEWTRTLIGRGCTFLEKCESSFMAEALALEGAMDLMVRLFCKTA